MLNNRFNEWNYTVTSKYDYPMDHAVLCRLPKINTPIDE